MAEKQWTNVDNILRKLKDEPRYPPRTPSPGPPLGQDYDTLTAKHGKPRGAFEPKQSEERGGR